MQQVMDARAGFARHSQRYSLIDQSRADRDGIGGMCLRTVALSDRSRDAALRPGRRGTLTQWCTRNHGDGARRQF